MEWQPIETAPTDGTKILCWFPDLETWDVCRAASFEIYGERGFEWVDQWNDDTYGTQTKLRCEPSHWMPLREPPKDSPS